MSPRWSRRRPRGWGSRWSTCRVTARTSTQGQRSLNRCSGKDFQQEVLVPAATATFHDQAVATGMLLQQREREAIEPRKVLPEVLVPNARFILAIRHVQA